MLSTCFFAHTKDTKAEHHWQRLEDHLAAVATLAARFAAPFEAEGWGRAAGMWHDIGKYSDAFQDYLRTASSPDSHIADGATRTDHSTAGAQHAVGSLEILGHLLAYVVAGHHSGLLDGRSDGACLEARLRKEIEPWEHRQGLVPPVEPPVLPRFMKDSFGAHDDFAIAFFTRMLFSCLVDADFLDTEAFMAPERAGARPEWPDDLLARMERELGRHIDQLPDDDSHVNRHRGEVRKACLEASALPPGLFSLTVPTGGGKTLSSLAFALRHALRHGLHRVIYVIPFTSIIEQTADEFRKVFASLATTIGMDLVLEHHSSLDVGKETVASRLATENWAAPLIVTTSVQFYESLFAQRTSRCRKLHNLARSVIILDEVQTLPVDYLQPCLRAIHLLADHYGASMVLTTATQPAINRREGFEIGLDKVQEIIPRPGQLYQSLSRVTVEYLGEQGDDAITDRVLSQDQVLCIVNTRGHAQQLFASLGEEEGHFHLSALMCPEHRSEMLKMIRARLRSGGRTCRVVSTQLIEAGVDIDFPVVFRAMAGLDSIAQAAGRCNRNGKLQRGMTYVFRSEHVLSERYFADTANIGSQILDMYSDPLGLEAIEQYFRLYYWNQSDRWDRHLILKRFCLLNDRKLPFDFRFAEVARVFHLIENTGHPVIIPWREKGRSLCEKLRAGGELPGSLLLRELQRYTVQIPRHLWERHQNLIDIVHERYAVLISPEIHYSELSGLKLDEDSIPFLNV